MQTRRSILTVCFAAVVALGCAVSFDAGAAPPEIPKATAHEAGAELDVRAGVTGPTGATGATGATTNEMDRVTLRHVGSTPKTQEERPAMRKNHPVLVGQIRQTNFEKYGTRALVKGANGALEVSDDPSFVPDGWSDAEEKASAAALLTTGRVIAPRKASKAKHANADD